MRGTWGSRFCGDCVGRDKAGGEFVEADGDGLAEVHGGLGFGGGDEEELVAEGEVLEVEAVVLGAEEESESAASGQLRGDCKTNVWQK